jgi:hypothetical protein
MLVLNVAFATLVTTHVALVFGLAFDRPRWRALVALVAVPLAPYWGHERGMRLRALIWVIAAVAYGASLIAAL